MMTFSNRLLLSILLGLPTSLSAQQLVDVYTAKPGEELALMPPFQRGLAVARDGSIWLLFVTTDAQGTRLVCIGSHDGGKTFGKRIVLGSGAGKQGSIVADVRRPILHVAWTGNESTGNESTGNESTGNGTRAGPFRGVLYQAIDCDKAAPIGTPQLLLRGKGAEDQFHAADIEMTAAGDLALTVFTHRSPDPKVWGRGWAAGVLLRRASAAKWSDPIVVNRGFTGINVNVHAIGEQLAFAYRTHGAKGYGIYARAYDLGAGRWIDPDDIPVRIATPKDGSSDEPTNTSCIGADLTGNTYVLYTMGSNANGKHFGRLVMAFRPAHAEAEAKAETDGGARPWRSAVVTTDAPLPGGNHNPVHFTLARGPGNQMYAIYSKLGEEHSTLYTRVFDGGRAITKERAIAADGPGAFAAVNGLRSSQADSTLFAATLGKTKAAPHGRIALVVLGRPVKTFWRSAPAARKR